MRPGTRQPATLQLDFPRITRNFVYSSIFTGLLDNSDVRVSQVFAAFCPFRCTIGLCQCALGEVELRPYHAVHPA